MKANGRARHARNDDGVSPVIAVILMVAITVVLAATVYVWTSGFASDDQGPENASAAARGFDSSGDGQDNWIRVTLTRGDNTPYDGGIVAVELVTGTTPLSTVAGHDILCDAIDATTSGTDYVCGASSVFAAGDTWDIGQTLFVPCQRDGSHSLLITVADTTVLDATIKCDDSAV